MGGLEQGGHDVDVGGDLVVVGSGLQLGRPAHEEGGSDAAVVHFVFLAARGADIAAGIGAIIDHEDDDGIAGGLSFIEVGKQFADVLVDVLHHRVNASDGVGVFVIAEEHGRKIFVLVFPIQSFGYVMVGTVRGVGRDVGEKGFLGLEGLVDEFDGAVEIDVGAVTLSLYLLVIAEENGVGVATIVFARFGGLTESAAEMDEGFLEPLIGSS